MNNKLMTFFLGLLCVVLAAGVLFIRTNRDKSAPEITYTKEAIYYDGENTDSLLQGVTAVDQRDGDVTDTVIVRSIYPVSKDAGVVVYAAKDSSNNVATLSRGFFYEEGANPIEIPETLETEETAVEETTDTDMQTEEIPGETTPVDGQEMTEEQYAALRETNMAEGIPFVKLLQHEATLSRGTNFSIYRYIDEVVDDKDTINTMLHVNGNVDSNTTGEYEIQVYARDSDGNESNTETITVTVE